jgi:metal-dependent amidase/aminoacylase/carboxypeptidase family protein
MQEAQGPSFCRTQVLIKWTLILYAAEHPAGDLGVIVDRFRPDFPRFEGYYQRLHQLPELPTQEKITSWFITEYLRDLEFSEILENIGGHGIVAIFRNGPEKTVLIRAELDALPVQEKTGLFHASRVTQKDPRGCCKACNACLRS